MTVFTTECVSVRDCILMVLRKRLLVACELRLLLIMLFMVESELEHSEHLWWKESWSHDETSCTLNCVLLGKVMDRHHNRGGS